MISFVRFLIRSRGCEGLRIVAFGQEEGEGTSFARLALKNDLAAEQTRDLSADGKPKAGTTVFTARCAVLLLKSLENQLLFVFGNADPRIADSEGYHPGRPTENGIVRAPARRLETYRNRNFSMQGELESVRKQVL